MCGGHFGREPQVTHTAKQVVFPCSLACTNRLCYLYQLPNHTLALEISIHFSWAMKLKSSLFPSLRQTDGSWRTKFGKMPPYGQKNLAVGWKFQYRGWEWPITWCDCQGFIAKADTIIMTRRVQSKSTPSARRSVTGWSAQARRTLSGKEARPPKLCLLPKASVCLSWGEMGGYLQFMS